MTAANGTAIKEGRRIYADAERHSKKVDELLAQLSGEAAVQAKVIKLHAFTRDSETGETCETCFRFLAHLQRAWWRTDPEIRPAMAAVEVARFIREQAATLRKLGQAYDQWTDTEGLRLVGNGDGPRTAELVGVRRTAVERLGEDDTDGEMVVIDLGARDGAR